MTEKESLVSSAVNDDLAPTSAEIDEDNMDFEDTDLEIEPDDGEVQEDEQVVQKDYKQKFNSAMSNLRKKDEEIAMLKRSKTHGDVSDANLDKLREKYDENDLEIIQSMIQKGIQENSQSTLAQKEQNIFLKNHPEVTEPQLKHINWMQKEFGYSLTYAYDITFGKSEVKHPVKHSISTGSSDNQFSTPKDIDKGKQDDADAYEDMKKHYV